jgi:hypothetical protein
VIQFRHRAKNKSGHQKPHSKGAIVFISSTRERVVEIILEGAPILKKHVLQIRIFEKLAACFVTPLIPASNLTGL